MVAAIDGVPLPPPTGPSTDGVRVAALGSAAAGIATATAAAPSSASSLGAAQARGRARGQGCAQPAILE